MERPVFVVCPKCGGEGVISSGGYCPEYRCVECDGSGAVEEDAVLISQEDIDEIEAEERVAEK